MQLDWLYSCGICQMMPLKVWPNTAIGCNHQSICMPQLQPLIYINTIDANDIKDSKFISLAVDTSNHNSTKLAPVLIRYFKPSTGIKTKIIEFSEIEGETSEIICYVRHWQVQPNRQNNSIFSRQHEHKLRRCSSYRKKQCLYEAETETWAWLFWNRLWCTHCS